VNKRKIFELSLSLLITFCFVYLFYKVIGFKNFVKFFDSISFINLILAFFLYVLSYILRALRWKLTLPIKDFFKLFKLTVYNTVFNIFLPFRTGEISFFYILKNEGVEISKSAVSFFTVRIFDAYSLIVLFVFSFLVIFNIFLGIAFILLSFLGIIFLRLISKFIKYEKFRQFREDVLDIKNVIILFVFSVFTLIFKFTAFYLVIPKEINLDYFTALFACASGDLTTILPIHGIAGIGTYEGGFAGILILLGIDTTLAVSASVFVHLFMLVSSAILALFTKIASYILKA